MGHSARDCYEVTSYEQAEEVFNKIKPPRSSHNVWRNTNVRPLKRGNNRTTYRQYRIEKNERDGLTYYDIVLYGTIIARYHKPQGDMSTVFYNYYNSDMTRDFMWHVLRRGWKSTVSTTDGRVVVSPIGFSKSSHRVVDPADNAPFAMRCVFVGDKLDTDLSYHSKFYTKVSTDEDKAKRAAVRKRVEAIVDLACMRLPTMEQEAQLDHRAGKPFGMTRHNQHCFADWRGLADPDVSLDDAMTEEALQGFLGSAQSVYNTLASKRMYKQGGSYFGFRDSDVSKLRDPITEPDFRASMMRFILEQTKTAKRSGKKYLPMWADPSEWPETGVFAE